MAYYKGCGDFTLSEVSTLPDPCPLPEKTKRRSLNEKERLMYAPMAGVGGVVYDKVHVCVSLDTMNKNILCKKTCLICLGTKKKLLMSIVLNVILEAQLYPDVQQKKKVFAV